MACIIREDGKTYRLIELEYDEDQQIMREAKEAQISVGEYIRSKVLSDEAMRCNHISPEDSLKSKILELLQQHKTAVSYIAEQVSWFTCEEKPSYWVFDVNLTFIKELLEDLKKADELLQKDIREVIDSN